MELFFKILLCIILIILVLWFLYGGNKEVEQFKEKSNTDEDNIENILKKANKEINANPEKWLIYNASKKNNEYLLIPDKSVEIAYKVTPAKSKEGKIIYEILKDNDQSSGISGVQDNENFPDLYGRFETSIAQITFKRSKERITIKIGTGIVTIIGYGGFDDNSIYPCPWCQVMPIVYKEGNAVIGIMNYTGNKKDVSSKTTYLPMEIIISKDNTKYLPLFFNVYVLLQKYISSSK